MSNPIDFNVYLNTLRQKGNLAYEYNPLYNYQTDEDLYLIDNKYIVPYGLAVNTKNGELLIKKGNKWIDKRGRTIDSSIVKPWNVSSSLWAKAGSLIDLDTEYLNFDLDHPVEIEVLPSYDGSVNLILNDDKNIPRLINSRFSVREKDTYEIVDRIGENDTNIYNSKTFDKDTSLYFLYEYNPTITYLGFIKGILPVGLYCFYFTYCDADDNESDFIAESGLIPIFIGNDSDPYSMDGGIKNQTTDKGILFRLNNMDKSYNYLKVYYVRYFADYLLNRVYECKKIYKKIPIDSSVIYILITGYESTEDLDANILNISRFNPKSVLTQTLCKNMLFFGNIVKNTDNYKELTDIALRISPELNVVDSFDALDKDYNSNSGDFAYYNTLNIYNKTGYFNLEYYRFGVVFIYLNGTLSNVYNTLGGDLDINNSPKLLKNNSVEETFDLYEVKDEAYVYRKYVKIDDYGWVKRDDENYNLVGLNVNAKGVCRFNYSTEYNDNTIFSVKFKVPGKISKYLREDLGIRGLFFVRQKCVPNIIALCYLLGMDETLEAPVLETGSGENKKHYTECFIGNDRQLTHIHSARLYKYKHDSENSKIDNVISSKAYAGLCPDFSLNLPFYNQIFNGGKFRLLKVSKNSELILDDRFFNENQNVKYDISEGYKKATICTVTENVNTVAILDLIYRLDIGEAEEAYRFKYAEVDNGIYNAGENDFDKINESTNIVRGKYSPYLAIYSNSGELETGCLYNIYLDSPIDITLDFLDRMNSIEPFYSISDRYNLTDDNTEYVCWRGDCYINLYSHRMSRNFNDPSLPNNDTIITVNTWKDYYKSEDPEEWENISRSDVNAVQIGSWITFKVRSAMNYALRSVDHSYVAEEAMMGSPRSFYPKSFLLLRGANKIPDSYLYNDAYRASLGFKCYFTLLDINYIKDTFSNRIQYSAIAILDSFKNNYRLSLSTYFRDYSLEYGSILKLVGFEGYILVVFEHAIGIAVVNERVLAGSGDGEPVFINSNNVLPEELTIITDTYGTQWGDSVIKSEAGYVYGVDTNAKKIWRVKGQQIEILSDFKVNKFLIDNITLGERELYPTVGLRNVKTHYNNNKKDIMFTFYDDIYKDEEKVWNLCYNELLELFITFYSWVPSYSENIDTKFFSFNRNTAKELTLLAKCNYSIPENSGVLVDSPIIDDSKENILMPTLYYVTLDKSLVINYTVINPDGTTSLKSFTQEGDPISAGIDLYILLNVDFKIERDHWGIYKLVEVDNVTKQIKLKEGVSLVGSNPNAALFTDTRNVVLLYITPYLNTAYLPNVEAGTVVSTEFWTEIIALTLSSVVENPLLTIDDKNLNKGLTTDFYLHGLAGIFNVAENTYPTYWYGEFHPFEFEFVVNDKVALLKIFTDLIIVSNKAEPESFHFEIEGDNYEFSEDKRVMYFRQEATKELYLNLGSDIIFNRYYTDVAADKYTYELYYRTTENQRLLKGEDQFLKAYKYNGKNIKNKHIGIDKIYPIYSHGLVRQVKSTIFPLYYERVDTYNEIYDKYHLMRDDDGIYDFENLTGSEVAWNRELNQFNIITHVKNSPIDYVGRLRGNSRYKEGKWNILIPSIYFMLKNERWNDPESTTYDSNQIIICDKTYKLCDPDYILCGTKTSSKGAYFMLCESELCGDNVLACDSSNKIKLGISALPPIVVNSQYLPNDLDTIEVSSDRLPNIYNEFGYNVGAIEVDGWTLRKETKIRDKWVKIRVRYSGKNLAVIHSLITLYNVSYS